MSAKCCIQLANSKVKQPRRGAGSSERRANAGDRPLIG
nr:MAG TPA: hypothetical protein [Caudoviricetes sp.]